MSRIGAKFVAIPSGVDVVKEGNGLSVRGSLGKMTIDVPNFLLCNILDSTLSLVLKSPITIKNANKLQKSSWGLVRSLITNAVFGVSVGYTRKLNLIGVGYRAHIADNVIIMYVGYSHHSAFMIPEGMKASIEANTIVLSHYDKYYLGMAADAIRRIRVPELYKGKGIRYDGELIALKEVKK